MLDAFLNTHSDLMSPLDIAAGLGDFLFFESDELLDSYHSTLWASHILPGVAELFGDDFASTLEWTPSEAALIKHFIESLVSHMAEREMAMREGDDD